MSTHRRLVDFADALREVCGGDMVSAVGRTFELMEVAERAILSAKATTPKRAHARLDRAFGLLFPGQLARYDTRLYAAHARELLRRVVAGADLRPATDAELLHALSTASLVAPPGSAHARLMAQVFFRVYPEKKSDPAWADALDDVGREAYPGQLAEIETTLRRRAGDPKRELPPPVKKKSPG